MTRRRRIGLWRRVVDWRHTLVIGEAIVALTVATLAIRFLPFRRVMALADLRPPRRPAVAPMASQESVRRAVRACSRRLPWHPVCFPQGLAAHWMLHRRGVATTLCYGARPDAARGVEAHVWVVAGTEPVIGVEAAAGMSLLIRVPAETAD